VCHRNAAWTEPLIEQISPGAMAAILPPPTPRCDSVLSSSVAVTCNVTIELSSPSHVRGSSSSQSIHAGMEEFQVTGKNRSTAIPVFSWPFPTADEAIAVLPRMACRVQG
jgi:hypothetical protein